MYRTDFGTLWEKVRVGCSKRTALKQVCYQGWNRSPAQVGCTRQMLRAGTLGRPRGMGWRGKQEGGLEWETHINPWLIHVNVWQKPLQYCKVISLQLIKINEKRKKKSGFRWEGWYDIKDQTWSLAFPGSTIYPFSQSLSWHSALKVNIFKNISESIMGCPPIRNGQGCSSCVEGCCSGKNSWSWGWVLIPALSSTGHMTSNRSPDLCD